jgi:hypothetical protein
MDLNFQYSEHQQSLMRAMASDDSALRTRHFESAGSVARRIQDWQHAEGANAANDWACVIDEAQFLNLPVQRTIA